MLDTTLDGLLLALLQKPEDPLLPMILADYLEETGHPAGDWWREKYQGLYQHSSTGDLVRIRVQKDRYPTFGWDDLSERLTRLYRENRHTVSLEQVQGQGFRDILRREIYPWTR